MFCKYCGKENPDGAKFCGSCGTVLTAPQGTASKHSKAPKGKKRPVTAIVAVVLVIAVLAAVAAFGGGLGKKTVYLMTETITSAPDEKYEDHYEYDEQGRLTGYEYSFEGSQEGIRMAWEYTYDEKGRIETAQYEDTYMSFELEYIYDKDGRLEEIESDNFGGEVECDRDGRITAFELTDIDQQISAEFSYFENGVLEEMEYEYGGSESTFLYDENGRLLEHTFRSMMTDSRYQCEYDKEGRILSETDTFYDAEGKVQYKESFYYSYDKKGLWESYTVEYDAKSEDFKLTVECEVEGDAEKREAVITDISGDRELFYWAIGELEEGDTLMKEEYDDRGVCVERTSYGADTVKTTFEYQPFKVPGDYIQKPSTTAEYFWYLSTDPTAIIY